MLQRVRRMNGRTRTMRCPHCGIELPIDDLYMEALEEEFKERNDERIREAISFQKTEANRRVRVALRELESKQEEEKKQLLDKIALFEKDRKESSEKLRKSEEEKFGLQQALQNAEAEAQKKVNAQVAELYEKARKESRDEVAEEMSRLRKEKEDAMKATEDLRRKLDQGSQQLQGEVRELELEELLRSEYPMDEIEGVAKGRSGADVIQSVCSAGGRPLGRIVWECKSVKNWNNDFIPKLRSDVGRAGGDVGILVSNVFGRGMGEFECVDGVWLVRPENAVSMSRLVRDGVVRAGQARLMAERKDSVQDAVYEFVTSPAFRNRIQMIGAQYRALDESIAKARDTMEKQWATQRKLIDELVSNTQGMLGDVDAFLIQAGPGDVQLLPPSDEGKERESGRTAWRRPSTTG